MEIAVGLLGFASVARPLWAEIRAAVRFMRLADTEPRKRLRRQIRRQYRAEVAVRRELTLDPWFGRGGRLLFHPGWSGIKGRR